MPTISSPLATANASAKASSMPGSVSMITLWSLFSFKLPFWAPSVGMLMMPPVLLEGQTREKLRLSSLEDGRQ